MCSGGKGAIQLRRAQAHLSRLFKHAFGVIPADYRALEANRTAEDFEYKARRLYAPRASPPAEGDDLERLREPLERHRARG
jgi:hypothetical protein